MEEKEQQEFISWLSDQLQATDEADFEQKVQQLGEEGIKEAHIAFKREKVKQYMTGGALEKIKELKEFKRTQVLQAGGKVGYQPVPQNLDWTHQDYTSAKGNTATDADYRAYKAKGLDFGNTKGLAAYKDSWIQAAPAAVAQQGYGYENQGLHNRQIGGFTQPKTYTPTGNAPTTVPAQAAYTPINIADWLAKRKLQQQQLAPTGTQVAINQQGGKATRKLKQGGTEAVAKYQEMLNKKYGLNLAVDGAWGPQTQGVYEYEQMLKRDPGLKNMALPMPKEALLQKIVEDPTFLQHFEQSGTVAQNREAAKPMASSAVSTNLQTGGGRFPGQAAPINAPVATTKKAAPVKPTNEASSAVSTNWNTGGGRFLRKEGGILSKLNK